MLFEYEDKAIKFKTDDRELGRLFLQRRLPAKSRDRAALRLKEAREWAATLPIVQWIIRLFGGDIPSGP